jgi:site-specific DNA-methyltransferase (adenine-specific)
MESIVFNEDCMEVMKRYPDNHFDLAVVDPPYGININMNMGRKKNKRKRHIEKDWDSEIPCNEYWDALFRVSKNQIVWGVIISLKYGLMVVVTLYFGIS